MPAYAAHVEVSVTKTPPRRPRVAARSSAESELYALLEEISTWDDAMLLHMHERFSTSRLFRVRYRPDGPLTERAIILRNAAQAEIDVRGLNPPADERDEGAST